jgi:hypothetical protein
MDIVLVFSDWFFFLRKFRFKILFEIIICCWSWLRRLRLYLTMYDLINGYVGINIFIFFALLFLIELVSLCYFSWFFVAVRIMFWIMLQSYFHILHSSV